MARRLYSVFFYLILPLVLLRLCYRASKSGAYARRIAERFGYFKAPAFVKLPDFKGAIWIHSVSVGETIAAAGLVKQLQLISPNTPVVVTTMTPTGSERVKALFGESVFHVYVPYDLPGSVKRFLHRVQPKLLVIIETELWPNTVYFCDKNNIPVVLANARLSEKSANGYQRFSLLSKPMLQQLSTVAAQYQADAERFINLGLPAQSVQVTGNIKFDLQLGDSLMAKAAQLKSEWSDNGRRIVFVAASTHEGEDEIILQAFQHVLNKFSHLLLVLVPRHPERFDKVAALCENSSLKVLRRSAAKLLRSDTQVLIGDTMGELLLFYGGADIAFVGGSLVPKGGHNILEPAVWGVPIITGESDFNFTEINRLLSEAGGIKKINSAEALTQTLNDLASDTKSRHAIGRAALSVVESNRGALNQLLTLIQSYLVK